MELLDFLDFVKRGEMLDASRLFGRVVDASFRLFPPFYTDFGKNITVGRNICYH